MRNRFFALSVCIFLAFSGVLQAQTHADLWHENFVEYIKLAEKDKYEKAIPHLSEASLNAKKAKIDNNAKILTWFIYIGELLTHDPQSKDISEYLRTITSRGPKLGQKSESYGIDLIMANAHILRSAYVKKEWRPVMHITAMQYLNRLETEKVPALAEEDYKFLYQLSEISVSENERMTMIQYIEEQIKDISGEDWYNSAVAVYDGKLENYNFAVRICLDKSKQKNYPEAWAMEGYLYEKGTFIEKDKLKAAESYRTAAQKGSVWGKIAYAGMLIDGIIIPRNCAEAKELLLTARDDENFMKRGGGYHLARLYEKGWEVEQDLETAIQLYADSYTECGWKNIKDLSIKGSVRIENKMVENAIDKELAGTDPRQMSAMELTAVAKRYEAVGAHEKAYHHMQLAADKGGSYSACWMGLKFFKESDDKDYDLLEKAFNLFLKGATGNYAPCNYNVAVMYLYGYGTSPDHEKAYEYFERYINKITVEGYDGYDRSDYLETIGGIRYKDDAIKRGIPLKTVIEEFENASDLYTWAYYREKDSRPEIPIYFYTRAAKKGHPKAEERLKAFKEKQVSNKE